MVDIGQQDIRIQSVALNGPLSSWNSALADYYLLLCCVEKQNEVNKIRARFICVAFSRLKHEIKPGRFSIRLSSWQKSSIGLV